jgi:hypothetical protein
MYLLQSRSHGILTFEQANVKDNVMDKDCHEASVCLFTNVMETLVSVFLFTNLMGTFIAMSEVIARDKCLFVTNLMGTFIGGKFCLLLNLRTFLACP